MPSAVAAVLCMPIGVETRRVIQFWNGVAGGQDARPPRPRPAISGAPRPPPRAGGSGNCAQSDVNTSVIPPSANCGTVVVGMYLGWSGMPNERFTKTLPPCATSTVAPPADGLTYFLNSESMNDAATGDSSAARCVTWRVARL